MKKLSTLTAILTAAVAVSAAAADNYHGSVCQWQHNPEGVSQDLSGSGLFIHNDSAMDVGIICPVTVVQSIGHIAAEVDDVDLYGSNISKARFCVRAGIDDSERCGAERNGNGQLDLPHPTINGFVNEVMYIKMLVPAGSYSHVYGYDINY